MKRLVILTTTLLFIVFSVSKAQRTDLKLRNIDVDICIYGATSGGIVAAYTALKQGKKRSACGTFAKDWRHDNRRFGIYGHWSS